MGIEDFLDGPDDQPEVVEPTPEVVEPEQQPEVVTPEPEVPAEPPPEEPRHVPLATFLDQRDEAKRWKRQAEEAEAKLASQAPTNYPDPLDDPQGFAAAQRQEFQTALISERFATSEVIAKQQYGADVVEQAGLWAAEKAKSDKLFTQAYMQQHHPVDWIVQQHKQDQLVADIGGDPNAWFEREAAKRGYSAAPAPVPVQQPASVPTPPRSLASLPGNGGGVAAVATGPLSAHDALFQR